MSNPCSAEPVSLRPQGRRSFVAVRGLTQFDLQLACSVGVGLGCPPGEAASFHWRFGPSDDERSRIADGP
jgi:hypothetical protein